MQDASSEQVKAAKNDENDRCDRDDRSDQDDRLSIRCLQHIRVDHRCAVLPAEVLAVIQGEAGFAIVQGLDAELYHNAPGTSQSQLKVLSDRTPAHFHYAREHPAERETTKAQDIGTLFHCMVLEPAEFNRRYIVVPDDAPKRPTDAQRNAVANYRAWLNPPPTVAVIEPSEETTNALCLVRDDELLGETKPAKVKKPTKPVDSSFHSVDFWDAFESDAAGKEVVDADAYHTVCKMAESLASHPFARALLQGSETEVSVFWRFRGVLCRTRWDGRNRKLKCIFDLKSTEDASEEAFAKSIANYDYDVQATSYLEADAQTGGDADNFVFVCVEKKAPYGVMIYKIGSDDLAAAKVEYVRRIDLYAECERTGKWPSYPTTVKTITLPSWHRRQRGVA